MRRQDFFLVCAALLGAGAWLTARSGPKSNGFAAIKAQLAADAAMLRSVSAP